VIVYEKLQALLVKNPELISEVGLILVDELQYISEEERGATLEMLLTKILLAQASPQLVGLSAVLGKCENLAGWLNAKMLIEEKRPVELRKGVFFDGVFHYQEFNSGQEGKEEKNAIIDPRKWHFDPRTRSLIRISIKVSDFENMGGRVRRFGFIEDFGRAIFVTSSYVDFKAFCGKYIQGELEGLVPALDRDEMDKHIHNLIAPGSCHSPEEIKRFLKSTFTAHCIWNNELTNEDYDRIIRDTVELALRWRLIRKDNKGRLHATQFGKIVASKGIMVETGAHFLSFLHKTDPSTITDLEILTLLSLSKDAYYAYIPMKTREKGYRGYRLELQKQVSQHMEEGKEIFRGILKRSTRLAYEEERAIKKALMLHKWISPSDTREIENDFFIYSGAIRRVGEDFSWLAETLADLAREMDWHKDAVKKIEELSQRLIYGVSKEGLPLSQIRLRGLGRTYVNQLVYQGYDTPEAIAQVPQEELEKILPKRLAERLHKYCRAHYGSKEERPKEEPSIKKTWEVRPFSEVISNNDLLSGFRSHLALAENLSDLVTDPPTILIDEKQKLFFYQGYPVHLPPTTFKLMALLAKRPGEVVTRDEIYAHLWPDLSNPGSSSNPYDRQVSDHKRKITTQIKKALKGKTDADLSQIKDMIHTKRKVGYVLNVKYEEVFLLV